MNSGGKGEVKENEVSCAILKRPKCQVSFMVSDKGFLLFTYVYIHIPVMKLTFFSFYVLVLNKKDLMSIYECEVNCIEISDNAYVILIIFKTINVRMFKNY